MGTAAERPGNCRPADAESAGTLQYQLNAPQLGRAFTSFHRSKEAGVRGPCGVLRGHGFRGCSAQSAYLQRIRRSACQTDRSKAYRPTGQARQTQRLFRYYLSDDRGQRRQYGLAHSEHLLRMGFGFRAGRLGILPPEPRTVILAQSGRSQ